MALSPPAGTLIDAGRGEFTQTSFDYIEAQASLLTGAFLSIQETAGQNRSLLLKGPALPPAGSISFGSVASLQTRHYGARSTQQVVGFNDEPISISGTWDTVRLSRGEFAYFRSAPVYVAQALEEALEDLRKGGEVLRVQFGHRVRYGRISKVKTTPQGWGELAWSLEIVPIRRDDQEIKQKRVPSPETASDAFSAAMEAALGGIEWFEDQVSEGVETFDKLMNRYVDGPLGVVNAGSRAFQQAVRGVEHAVDRLSGVGIDYTNALIDWREAFERIGGIADVIRSNCYDWQVSIETLIPEAFAATNNPVAQLDALEELGSTLHLERNFAEEAARLLARSQDVLQGADNGFRMHTMRDGEDLREVSERYYGTPDYWPQLAAYNGFGSSRGGLRRDVTVPPLEVLV